MHSSFAQMLHCSALEEDHIRKALRAVEVLAYYFRDDPYSKDYGWVPRFKVTPTHAAIYRGAGEAKLQHALDVRYEYLDRYFSQAYATDPDGYEDLFHITYDEVTGAAEWVPGCGPAPIWSHPDAALTMSRQEMADLVDAFIKERW